MSPLCYNVSKSLWTIPKNMVRRVMDFPGWTWMDLDGPGWTWMDLDGPGWTWVDLDGLG